MHIGIIATPSPPLAHVSVRRAYNIAKQLSNLGHKVSLVTIDYTRINQVLRENEGDIGSVEFIRIDPTEWYPRFFDQTQVPPKIEEATRIPLFRYVRSALNLLSTGPWPNWYRAGVREINREHKRNPFHIFWAIHGDQTCHEIAYSCFKQTGVPWVADFWDPWLMATTVGNRWLKRVRMKHYLNSCKIATDASLKGAEINRKVFSIEVQHIPSGIDLKLMENAKPRFLSKEKSFNIYYFGSINQSHDFVWLETLLKLLSQSHLASFIDWNFVGQDCEAFELLRNNVGISKVCKFHRYIDHSSIYSFLKGADLLYLAPQNRDLDRWGGVGMKEFEYVASGRPILCNGLAHAEVSRVCSRNQLIQASSPSDAFSGILQLFKETEVKGRLLGYPITQELREQDWRCVAKKLETLFVRLIRR